jgi:hypothetical protein
MIVPVTRGGGAYYYMYMSSNSFPSPNIGPCFSHRTKSFPAGKQDAIALVGGQMVKQRVAFIPRGATVAWGPTTDCAGMIASGTVGGAFDGSFDATASLEIFQMDLSSKTGQMEMLGSVQTPERFHRLAWGSFGANCSSLPLGMLAGGMVDGTVKVFDPAVLAR